MKKYSLNIMVIISLLFSMGPAHSTAWLVESTSNNVILPVHAACENNSDVDKQSDEARSCAKHCATQVAMTLCDHDYLLVGLGGKTHIFTKALSVSLSYKIVLPPPKTPS